MPRKSKYRPLLMVARHFGYPIYVANELPVPITDDIEEATRWDERDLTWLKLARYTAETGYPFCFEDVEENIVMHPVSAERIAHMNNLLAKADSIRQRLTAAAH